MADLLPELRKVELIADFPDGDLQWLIDHSEEMWLEAGATGFEQGSPADRMFIILEGEVEGRGGGRMLFNSKGGEIGGKLPHSRMKTFPLTVRAVTRVHLLQIREAHFEAMLDRMPTLETRLIGLMTDRVREFTTSEVQQSKLAALGKLSAGLAHELNNPAAAATRAASRIREQLGCIRELDCAIASADLTSAQRAAIVTAEAMAIEHARGCTPLDAVTRSDREDELGRKLAKAGVEEAWDLASELVDAGFDGPSIKLFAEQTGSVFREALARTALLISTDRLAEEIQESMSRISALVKSIKEYSYLDTAAERDVDVHRDIENTLRILASKINKAKVTVEREYDKNLPTICANGSELNQVWTNLIDNAVDAMAEMATADRVLRIHTAVKLDRIFVEIMDTGPGVPEALQAKIFEPFFTTKKQGQGTGLGLDAVQRVVRRHHGDLLLESRPGKTCFQVFLPIRRNKV